MTFGINMMENNTRVGRRTFREFILVGESMTRQRTDTEYYPSSPIF